MDPRNAIELHNVSKSFEITVEDVDKKSTFFNKIPTKTIKNQVLSNITLNIRKGEVLGIIGRNGSGKSTLLSLLARILEPDEGVIERSGKIASILELGMGFHPDMSGRENIYLKGELYGFSKNDMDARVDTIIEYSGIEKYIDNPVRTYSSGMAARLAFAIMVNVESEIMLVDEVLSVGDLSFETKAKQHFKKLSKTGKTIIFVSHQISFLEEMCTRVIWIESGSVFKDGLAKDICSEYIRASEESPEIIQDLAESGSASAQYTLSLMYRDGINYNKNDELYIQWIKKSAEQGFTKAQVQYADYLLQNDKLDEAREYYLEAAKKGDNEARMKFSKHNLKRENNITELIALFEQLNESNDGLFEYRYANILLKTAWTYPQRMKAFEYFSNSAKDGFVNAMHQIAIMYRDGDGTTKDLQNMEKNLRTAADLGYLPSITLLADYYFNGQYVKKDYTLALKYAEKAASLGNVSYMFRVARMYEEGLGTENNTELANKWYASYINCDLFWQHMWASEYISDSGIQSTLDPESLLNNIIDLNSPWTLGNAINLARVKENDISTYLDRMEYQAINGNFDAITRLGNIYYDGAGVNQNTQKAIEIIERGAKLGNIWCYNKLGEIYRDGRGIESNYEKSTIWFKKAAKLCHVGAIGSLINMYVAGTIKDQNIYESSMKQLKILAKNGNVDAMRRLGNYYYDGVGVKKDYAMALNWYVRVANMGDAWCKNRISEMYRDGKGVDKNKAVAFEWFLK